MKFTEDMYMSDIIQADPRVIEVLEKYGMHCCTCHGVFTGKLKNASRIHHVDLEALLKALNTLDSEKK